MATILDKSRGEEVLKVPLDVAQDLNLPVIVANNQRQEQLANVVNQIDKRLLLFTPQRPKTEIEFKEPPKVKRQTTFVFSDDEEEPFKSDKKDALLKSPPKIRRASPPRSPQKSPKPSQEDVYQRARENYLRDKPLAVSYGKLLAQTSKSQKVSVDSQIGAVEMIVPQTAEDALTLEMGRLRI